MNTEPVISVIMPCYNSALFIANSINSVLKQSFTNFELIILNDGSTDNSLEIINHYPDARIIVINQQNMGVCRARNNGLRIAKGKFIAFLDADDTWDTNCLTQLHQAFINQPETVIAYCGWQNIGLSEGKGKPFIPPNYQQLNKLNFLFENCCWPIHATLTRRFAIEEAKGFDESLLTSEDFLLWLKIASKHYIYLVPEVLAYYHFHDGEQASKNLSNVAINHWQAQKKFLLENPSFYLKLGKSTIKKSMHGELLRRGYECYWKRDLKAARTIFKAVMKTGYGSLQDWKYMLPSLLPYSIHVAITKKIDSSS